MNREILFRGKSLDTGEWVEGYLVKKIDPIYNDIETYYILNQKRDKFGVLEPLVTWTKVNAETIGQFTGLTDMNGVKIFEGDILKGQLDGEYPEDLTIVKVLWRHTGWSIKQEGFDCEPLEKSDGYLFEVVGNIHDNPEMLEEIK